MISFTYSCFLTTFFSFAFALFVLIKGPHRRTDQLWVAVVVSVGLWSWGQGKCVSASSLKEAFFWLKWFLYPGAILVPILYFHFVLSVLNLNLKKHLIIGYTMAGLSLVLNQFEVLYTARPSPPFNYYDFPLPAYGIFITYFFGFALYGLWLLYDHMRRAEGQFKNQLKYIFAGTAIGFGGGFTTFSVCYGLPMIPYGVAVVPIYIVTITYAVFRHRLMDINVVIRKTLIYSVVTTTLTALYVVITVHLARGLEGRVGSPTTFSSAAAACAMALFFHPLRMKIQRFIDRHFFREALDQALLREATSGFVHEIKRPLANISLPTELTLMDLEDLKHGRRTLEDVLPKMEQRLNYILDQTTDAGNKIEAIQEVSTTHGNPPGDLNLSEIIRRSLVAEDGLLSRNQIDVKLDIFVGLPVIQGRAKQLEIVICNLIKNAAEALVPTSWQGERTIWIKAFSVDRKVMVSVRDSGPGIKPENIPRLFDPYFTTKGAHGTGMGLFLCRQIIQAHGGELLVRNGDAQGAEFTVAFPAVSS